jgi:pimeloyl-ACP methyl ester carboxylesterase
MYRWVELRHGRTRYIEAGDGQPLLVLHLSSIESGADDCLPFLDVLARDFRVLAPDLLGWPPSDTHPDIDAFPHLVDFLRELQDALGVKSSHVVGASMGGWIAGLFAYESPDRCDRVVIGGHPFTGAPNRNMETYRRESVPADDRVRAWVEARAKDSDVDADALVAEKLAKIHEPGFVDAFATLMRSMGMPTNRERYATLPRLPYLRAPHLILLGERDEAAMELKTEVAAALAPTGELRTIASGHRMHIEDPILFAETVRDYLRPRAL